MPRKQKKNKKYKHSVRKFNKKWKAVHATFGKKNTIQTRKVDQNDIIRFNPRMNMYFPKEMITKFKQKLSFATLTGGFEAGRFDVKLNGLWMPFNPTAGGSIAVGQSGSNTAIGANQAGTPIADYLAPGASILLGRPAATQQGIYRNYMIYASRIKVTVVPDISQLALWVNLVPYNPIVYGIPNSPFPQLQSQVTSMPYVKQKLFAAGKGPMSISNYISIPQFIGCTSNEFKSAALAYNINNQGTSPYVGTFYPSVADPEIPIYWSVSFTSPDGVAWTNPAECVVEVEYYVRLFNLTTIPNVQN